MKNKNLKDVKDNYRIYFKKKTEGMNSKDEPLISKDPLFVEAYEEIVQKVPWDPCQK